jgi:sensor histidine kinase YesM
MTNTEIVLFVFCLVLFGFLISLLNTKKQLEKDKENLTKNLKKQEEAYNKLKAESLKFQLNPHAFRGTLSTLKYFTSTANQAVEHISEVLDYILYDSSEKIVSISKEVAFLEEYISLHKLKHAHLNAIKFKNEIDESNKLYTMPLIPPLVTAYFIENAFKHGELSKEDSLIVSLRIENDEFHYKVINTMQMESANKEKGGIGLRNMKERLDLLCNGKYTLTFDKQMDKHIASLKLKLN